MRTCVTPFSTLESTFEVYITVYTVYVLEDMDHVSTEDPQFSVNCLCTCQVKSIQLGS